MAVIDLLKMMAELNEELVVEGVKEQLAEGVAEIEILAQLQQGMEQVGKLYESGDYYLAELILAADVFSTAAKLLESSLTSGSQAKTSGTINDIDL